MSDLSTTPDQEQNALNADQSVVSITLSKPAPSNLLDLPCELRLKILRNLLYTTFYILLLLSHSGHLRRHERPTARNPLFPRILQASKQVHAEAAGVLYGENKFMMSQQNLLLMKLHLPTYFDANILNGWTAFPDLGRVMMRAVDFPAHMKSLTLYLPEPQRRVWGRSFQEGSVERERILKTLRRLKKRDLGKVVWDETYQRADMFKEIVKDVMKEGE